MTGGWLNGSVMTGYEKSVITAGLLSDNPLFSLKRESLFICYKEISSDTELQCLVWSLTCWLDTLINGSQHPTHRHWVGMVHSKVEKRKYSTRGSTQDILWDLAIFRFF